MSLRGINRAVHRDLGYFCVGLTVIYAVSGFLLNHIHDFNSNYRIETTTTTLNPDLVDSAATPDGVVSILRSLGDDRPVRAVYQPDPDSIQIFVEGSVVEVNLKTGVAAYERVSERTIFKAINDLHLNHAGTGWTWIADLYTLALALLAITGIFVLQGKKGITGRGAWLASAGLLLPLIMAVVFL